MLAIEQFCHVLYEVLVEPEVDDLVLEVGEFVMGLEELSQSAFEVAVFEGDVSEIRLLFGQLLFEAMVVVLSAV